MTDDIKNKRDLFLALCLSGSNADFAYLHNSKFTIEEYEEALETDEYKLFAANVNKNFLDNIDLSLLGSLYRSQEDMLLISAEHNNYPRIQKNYIDLLKITKPIIERLHQQKVEAEAFNGLELVIQGDEENLGI